MKIDSFGIWFGICFGLVGLICLLSGCFEWNWFWKLARGIYLPNVVGWERTRLIYIATGIGCLTIGLAITLQNLFDTDSTLLFMVSFFISILCFIFFCNIKKGRSSSSLVNRSNKKRGH